MIFSRHCFFISQGLGHPTARMSPGLACGWASSFIALRGIPQPSALQTKLECNRRALTSSAQEAAGANRSEIKEEPKAGDIRGGLHPLSLVRGARRTQQIRSTKWVS